MVLDEDMAQLRAKGPRSLSRWNVDDPYEVANRKFWYGLGGPDKMAEMKLKRDLFQATRNEFYKLNGRRSRMAVLEGLPSENTSATFSW